MYFVRLPYILQKFYPQAIWRKNPGVKKIYLTFDDGPIPSVTDWVLDVLKKYNVKATFFCVGDNVKKNPELFQCIINEKHSIGNHTFNHLNGWKTDTAHYIDNVRLCEQALLDYSPGLANRITLFRPPYGKITRSQISMLKSQYAIIMWDVLTGDFDSTTSPEKCLSNSVKKLRNGSIIVFHDNIKAYEKLEYALPKFIEYAQNKGFEFVCF